MTDAVFHVFMLNFVTAMDNVMILAAFFKQAQSHRKQLAILSAVVLTLTRVGLILCIQPISKFAGFQFMLGCTLLTMAAQMVRVQPVARETRSFVKLIGLIVITDLAMSFDNLVAILSATSSVLAASIGILFSTWLLVLLLPVIAFVCTKVPWVQILVAGVMAQTASQVLFNDPLWRTHFSMNASEISKVSIALAMLLVIIGFVLYFSTGKTSKRL